MMKKIKNLLKWTAWKMGWIDLPFWDDVLVEEAEAEESALREEERMWEEELLEAAQLPILRADPMRGEPLRAALAAASASGRWV